MSNPIQSSRLDYIPFTPDDISDLSLLYGNDEVCKYLPGEAPLSQDKIEKTLNYFIRTHDLNQKQAIYKVQLRETHDFVGLAGLQLVKEFHQIEVFYSFLPAFWNQGIATEASLRMIELARELDIEHLIALADTRNIGSNKVLLKCGFRENGQVDLWGLKLNFYELSLERT